MLRSRRLSFVAAAIVPVALVFSACGDPAAKSSTPTDSVAARAPRVINMSSNGGGQATVAGAAESDRMMIPQSITYIIDGQLQTLPLQAQAWMLPSGLIPDMDRVTQIATALGVTGDVVATPADQGGGWVVGSTDYTGPSLWVSADGMLTWWYSPAPIPSVAFDCEVGSAVQPIDDVKPTETVGGDAVVPEMPVDCATPTPPVGVPTGDEARASATAFFTSLGYDMSQFEFAVYADEWNASVSAFLTLNGMRAPLTLSIGYGENGAVTWASGYLAEPVSQGDYPLITIEEGLARLQDQSFWWGYGGVGLGGVADATARSTDSDVAEEPVGDIEPVSEVTIEPAPAPEPAPIEPLPVDVPIEPIEVHLNGVKADLTMIWSEDGTVWIVPAYSFTSTDGGIYTVIAVTDELLGVDDTVSVDPVPGDTVPVDTVPVDTLPVDTVVVDPPDQTAPGTGVIEPGAEPTIEAAAAVLVGLGEAEGAKVAAELGWEIRPTRINGEDQIITLDLRTNRVNVAVVDGVITEVLSIG